MLTQADVNILRMLSLGFGAKEIASTIGFDFKQFNGLYANLLLKTKCWDEVELGFWWQKNEREYTETVPDNLVAFDFRQ